VPREIKTHQDLGGWHLYGVPTNLGLSLKRKWSFWSPKKPGNQTMNKEKEILRDAKREAVQSPTWADFSNYLFDQESGLLAKSFPTRSAREAFMKTPEFKKIRQLLNEVRQRTGFVNGATPKRKSGRFVVRVPQSLHAALEHEAEAEGVSLNQLVVAKLAFQLGDVVRK
jgi:hypothetical protein